MRLSAGFFRGGWALGGTPPRFGFIHHHLVSSKNVTIGHLVVLLFHWFTLRFAWVRSTH